MRNIGIIGFGVVGEAVAHGFKHHHNIRYFDISKQSDDLYEVINKSEFIFVSVPTPAVNGIQDLTQMNDVLDNINTVAKQRKIVIIKSSMLPGSTRKYAEEYKDHTFVFNPEFLTDRIANFDFLNQTRIIIGGEDTEYTKCLYRDRFESIPIYQTSWECAEMCKYMTNTFYATKLTFLNEIKLVCDEMGIDFQEAKKLWGTNHLISNSHTDVPGHDGQPGFGGKCLTKDVDSYVTWCKANDLTVDVIESVQTLNRKLRTGRWFDDCDDKIKK